MIIVGIDPGISGAISVMENKKVVEVFDMPTMIDGKKNKKQVNGSQVTNIIKERLNDGKEIVASMKRATITTSGVVEWFETCFCSTPLQHERETQYDYYFSEITTELVDESGKINGKSFWSYMENKFQYA